MIYRLTEKLAKKIKEKPTQAYPPSTNPFADWTGHLFTVQRAHYVIVMNTSSLYSLILHGRGISDGSVFIDWSLEAMSDFLQQDGLEFQFRRFIVPETGEFVFSKTIDRRSLGSMHNLISMARFHLGERLLSPFDAARMLNQTPMSRLNYNYPREWFVRMAPNRNESG